MTIRVLLIMQSRECFAIVLQEKFFKLGENLKSSRKYATPGILAGVDMSEEMKNMAIEAGLYVANIQDEVFQIDTPPSFEPKAW